MRVLHVSQPVDAGVAAVAMMLAVDQRARGWNASIACPPGALAERAAEAGVPVSSWAATRSPGRSVPAESRALASLISDVDPDVVHLHSSKAGLAGRLAVRGRRPTLFQPHAWSFDAVGGATGAAARVWEVAASRWTHHLICVSEDELRLGREVGVRAPACVVPNGVDTERFAPRPSRAARRALGLPDGPTVLCLGRVTEQKGQDLLLAAWPSIRSRVPNATLVVVGDGPRLEEWQRDCDDPSVQWRPATDDPASWYHASDVVALPSRWEGMPLVALEAMAAERPVVGFDVTGVREAVGEAGAVVAAGDLGALAQAIVDRLRPGGPGTAQGAAGRNRALDLFDRRRTAAMIAALTENVVRDGRLESAGAVRSAVRRV